MMRAFSCARMQAPSPSHRVLLPPCCCTSISSHSVSSSRKASTGSSKTPAANANRQPRQRPLPPRRKSAWEMHMADVPGMRKRFVPAPKNPSLPTLDSLILVEGWTDAQAVHRAVNAAAYVCDGDTVKSVPAQQRLRALAHWSGDLVVLTDPDAGGRMLRLFLDDALRQAMQQQQPQQQQQPPQQQQQRQPAQQQQQQQQPPQMQQPQMPNVSRELQPAALLHAFVPINDAVSTVANSRHDVGSVGIENSMPAAICSSLESAGPSFFQRQEFTQQELMKAGFINAFNGKQVQGAKMRREVLCSALGIDNCTGSALVTALNRFFTRRQYEHAVRQAELVMATLPSINYDE